MDHMISLSKEGLLLHMDEISMNALHHQSFKMYMHLIGRAFIKVYPL